MHISTRTARYKTSEPTHARVGQRQQRDNNLRLTIYLTNPNINLHHLYNTLPDSLHPLSYHFTFTTPLLSPSPFLSIYVMYLTYILRMPSQVGSV